MSQKLLELVSTYSKQNQELSNLKSIIISFLNQVMKVGDPLGGLVVPHSASKPYVINDPR